MNTARKTGPADNAEARLAAAVKAMTAAGMPPIAIDCFSYYYQQLLNGDTGYIPERDIRPVTELQDAEKLEPALRELGRMAKAHTVMIKLNGGLGTSMGLDRAKSLIAAREGLTFLDIIARQAMSDGVPLLLMNSNGTRPDSIAALKQYPELSQYRIGLDFLQHLVPKIRCENLTPVIHDRAPEMEWCPPGHGDIYPALVSSGALKRMLTAGYRFAFISNADNLGATVDESILGFMVRQQCPFLLEAADRTAVDRKGGHFALQADGRLILRESAQCPPEDARSFQDVSRHRYFNTNNLWLDLQALDEVMRGRRNILGLPLIRNRKHVDPRDDSSETVYQLETAMGSAVSVFAGAQAIRVPRRRFVPVKTTNDLLLIRSDAYRLTQDFRLIPARSPAAHVPVIDLDARYYRTIDDFESRLPYGSPSLAACLSLIVTGDVKFGRGIGIEGPVTIRNTTGSQILLPDNSILRGTVNF
jgi:UTP--glucose-1-phosphate uridylyltransferase